MTTTYASSMSYGFNITIGLGKDNKEVNITAQDLNHVKERGLHFQLPPDTEVDLGSLSDLIDWLNDQLKNIGIDETIPTEAGSEWPETIKDIFNGILNTNVKVTSLSIDQEKQDTDGNYPPIKLNLAVTGTSMDTDTHEPKPIPIIDGLFSVIGGGISVNRTYTTTTE
ncbi:hypothetical protein ACFQ3J_06810 [Paenibacillus provencensis]|uniref:Phage tail protein n=1 Tax=Paenibacillus provencensis TaxID=441151 RepID=A0ABW3PTI1_9BACL|nr:hypothetical protein [Paenibacillus sp. MER 78]MCM3131021.1 hypothetical protein [Paenibacillus sp. MER 78]